MSDSVLPSSLSDLERDLEAALYHFDDISAPVEHLWNPAACPLPLLPYLAWALSVDQWSTDWPETRKRAVVAASLDIHRIKGTRQAVEIAVDSIDEQVDLIEWFEFKPPSLPGTFSARLEIDVWPDQSRLDQVRRVIDAAKRKSAHYDLAVQATNAGPVYVGCAYIDTVVAESLPMPAVIESGV
ncbi:phage tail protein I [Pontibacterium sp.]|uniref:phage tail protein I n=1 Tax=Pontibacterium sp. TaxID=2036026 RepID=UPI00356458A0